MFFESTGQRLQLVQNIYYSTFLENQWLIFNKCNIICYLINLTRSKLRYEKVCM